MILSALSDGNELDIGNELGCSSQINMQISHEPNIEQSK